MAKKKAAAQPQAASKPASKKRGRKSAAEIFGSKEKADRAKARAIAKAGGKEALHAEGKSVKLVNGKYVVSAINRKKSRAAKKGAKRGAAKRKSGAKKAAKKGQKTKARRYGKKGAKKK